METTVNTAPEPRASALLDVAEPDEAFLLASEQEGPPRARRRALVVLIADHAPDAPAVGDTAWAQPAVEPGDADDVRVLTRHDAVALAFATIDRHMERPST